MSEEILQRADYFNATDMEKELKALLKQFDKLRPRAKTLSQSYAKLGELDAKFTGGLDSLLEAARLLGDTTTADKQQANDRGMKELSVLCSKRLVDIQAEIKNKRNQFSRDIAAFRIKSNDLTQKGYSPEQIRKFTADTPEPPDADTYYRAVIKPLEDEQAALDAFVRDFPRYDQGVLAGTRFEGWQPEKVVDFDAAAGALAR